MRLASGVHIKEGRLLFGQDQQEGSSYEDQMAAFSVTKYVAGATTALQELSIAAEQTSLRRTGRETHSMIFELLTCLLARPRVGLEHMPMDVGQRTQSPCGNERPETLMEWANVDHWLTAKERFDCRAITS